MLGCQDFCGYYDWTFAHLRQTYGEDELRQYWSRAIAGEAQAHYGLAAARAGLKGLFDVWQRTGVDEQCDWTFTLDEERNTLRWDMRECPSKGFLLANDLHTDEDYCDHCMGWMIPLLNRCGVEVGAHEHNHCGQCWGEMHVRDRPANPQGVACDIRNDPRWNAGHLHIWQHGARQPVGGLSPDSCEVITKWFEAASRIVAVGTAEDERSPTLHEGTDALLLAERVYLEQAALARHARGILLEGGQQGLTALARRFASTPADQRPLLMYPYLPGHCRVDYVSAELPRPLPILPLLIRKGLYRHQPGGPHPTTNGFLAMLSVALGKPLQLLGVPAEEIVTAAHDASRA